jgi:DNA-binding NarL/FixJ family response regulator
MTPAVTPPAPGAAAAQAAAAMAPLRDAARVRAYLVEDNRLVRENLIAALEELAPLHVVGSAADERVALAWLGDDLQACDLMIIDVFMRGGAGLGVLAAARARRPGAAIVVLSNDASAQVRTRCLASGADRVFDKSRDIDLLVGYCTALARRAGGAAAH